MVQDNQSLIQSKISLLKAYVRESSLSTLIEYSEQSEIAIHEHKNEFLVRGEWIRLILVAENSLKITFKVHWFEEQGNLFACLTYHKPHHEIRLKEAIDFYGEYCNQVAGKIKWRLEQGGTETGVTLPLLLRGFDEIYFVPHAQGRYFEDCWVLESSLGRIVVSSAFEISDPDEFLQLELETDALRSSGEMEFL